MALNEINTIISPVIERYQSTNRNPNSLKG